MFEWQNPYSLPPLTKTEIIKIISSASQNWTNPKASNNENMDFYSEIRHKMKTNLKGYTLKHTIYLSFIKCVYYACEIYKK